ncbi:MAG: hypothetical protein P8181_11490, partial [bacterium]
MVLHPVHNFHRNLEETEGEIEAGRWRISTLADPITEKRYLLFKFRSRGLPNLIPSVVAYRCGVASIVAATGCAEVLSAGIEGDRVNVLTPYFDPVDPASLDNKEFRSLIETLLEIFAVFEHHRFYATDLFPETLGRNDRGGFVLLPGVYAIPALDASGTSTTDPHRTGVSRSTAMLPYGSGFQAWHTALLGRFLGDCAGGPEAATLFRKRASKAAEDVSAGNIATLDGLRRALFRTRARGHSGRVTAGEYPAGRDSRFEKPARQLVSSVSSETSVVVVRGESRSGKSAVLKHTARMLERSGGHEVRILDEWDLFARARLRTARTTKSGGRVVWIIDDIDDKTLTCSDLSKSMIESDTFPEDAVIMAAPPAGVTPDIDTFLDALEGRRTESFEDVSLETPSGGGVDAFVDAIIGVMAAQTGSKKKPPPARRRAAPQTTGPKALLELLAPAERQLLEFLAVAQFSLPLDVVFSVFPEPDSRVTRAACRLASLGILEQTYRHVSPKGGISVFFRVGSAGFRKAVYDTLTTSRRRTLHRSVALAGEQSGGFPAYFLLFHCLRAKEMGHAARHFVNYLKETKGGKRDPFILSLHRDLIDGALVDNLPFPDRNMAYHELAVDLLNNNKPSEAEQLLIECQELMDGAEPDQKLKSAAILSESLRLLADRWETRGEFKRALDLLDVVKFELQSALSIPEQAKLLNDIGWLQYRLGDYDGSMESCRLSLNTLNPNQYPLIVAQALNLMGV